LIQKAFKPRPVWLALFAAGCVAAFAAPPARQPMKGMPALPPLLPRVELLHAVFAAQQHMVADYYWIRSLEALGRANDAASYRDVYFYVKQVLDLDPDFRFAYLFGGTGVTFNLGRDRWVNTEESTELLARGVRRYPSDLTLRILYAYNLSGFHQRYRDAADVLAETAKLPDAPPFVALLAARLYARGGDIETGIALTEVIAADGDPFMRQAMEHRKKQLELERVLRHVDAVVQQFEAKEGRSPSSLKEMQDRGYELGELIDPLGGVISLDESHRAVSSSGSDRMLLYGIDTEAP
jgi:hypothetical protein